MKGKSKKAKVKLLSASLCLCGSILFLVAATPAQWIKQKVNTTASFRGLSVVNEKIVWASGTGGTVMRTNDGGKTWKVMTVPGAEKLDFRDIEAFDANTAYILSIGNGENSRVYKTSDGGSSWKEQFRNKNEKAFFDAIACFNRDVCFAVSDPVQGQFAFIATDIGGKRWDDDFLDNAPADNTVAKDGEAAFAASGTCLIVSGKNLFLVSGGGDARVFKLTDGNPPWNIANSPIVKGTPGSGIFSIAMLDARNGVIVGGNYEKPDDATNNLAFTSDGGDTWILGQGLSGYRSAVAYIDAQTIIAVGTNGTDLSTDSGKTWKKIGSEALNSVAAKGKNAVWAVGPNGAVFRYLNFPRRATRKAF